MKGSTENRREQQGNGHAGPGPIPPPVQLHMTRIGDQVMIQVLTTIVMDAAGAGNLAVNLADCADKARSAILIAGSMPAFPADMQ